MKPLARTAIQDRTDARARTRFMGRIWAARRPLPMATEAIRTAGDTRRERWKAWTRRRADASGSRSGPAALPLQRRLDRLNATKAHGREAKKRGVLGAFACVLTAWASTSAIAR
jgi:hypothetical protein